MRILGIAVIVAATALAACSEKPLPPPAEGTPAPDFALVSQSGKPVRLKDQKGKWVVLYFYPADFTKAGRIQATDFQSDLQKYEQANAAVFGVSVNDFHSHRAFALDSKLTFPLLSDPEAQVSRRYGSTQRLGMSTLAKRNTFIIDPDGRIVRRFLGVGRGNHSERVLAALDTLQRSRPGS